MGWKQVKDHYKHAKTLLKRRRLWGYRRWSTYRNSTKDDTMTRRI